MNKGQLLNTAISARWRHSKLLKSTVRDHATRKQAIASFSGNGGRLNITQVAEMSRVNVWLST